MGPLGLQRVEVGKFELRENGRERESERCQLDEGDERQRLSRFLLIVATVCSSNRLSCPTLLLVAFTPHHFSVFLSLVLSTTFYLY